MYISSLNCNYELSYTEISGISFPTTVTDVAQANSIRIDKASSLKLDNLIVKNIDISAVTVETFIYSTFLAL